MTNLSVIKKINTCRGWRDGSALETQAQRPEFGSPEACEPANLEYATETTGDKDKGKNLYCKLSLTSTCMS